MEEPRRAPGPRRAGASDTGGLCAVPRQADVLETAVTSSAGWNSQAFRGRKRISEHCKYVEPVFGGKRANLKAQAAQKTQDTKNAIFGVRRFQRFLLQKRSGDEAVTSLVTSVFWTKFGCFAAFFGKNPKINWSL